MTRATSGSVERDGFIRITGRLSRFAKIAGEMVPLERLDDEMHEVLATGGDRVLAVAAVPDEKRGERLIVLHLPGSRIEAPGLLAALPKRGIPNLWVPDRRDCYPVDADAGARQRQARPEEARRSGKGTGGVRCDKGAAT